MEKIDTTVEIKDEDIKEEDFTPEELEADSTDWKAKALELKGIAKRRATQLAKAKFKLSEVKPEIKPKPQDKSIENKQEPNEPNYGRLAFLNSRGIENPDDIKIVEDEADRLKLPLTDVLGMQHIKTQLQTNKEARTAQAGMPKGTGRSGGTTQQDVDYWLQKGGLPEDQVIAEKVVEARLARDPSQRKFSEQMFND